MENQKNSHHSNEEAGNSNEEAGNSNEEAGNSNEEAGNSNEILEFFVEDETGVKRSFSVDEKSE